jgi:hypothetical protein
MISAKFSAFSALIFLLLLTSGIITIPIVADYSNHVLAEEAASQTVRWLWGHIISGVAFVVSVMVATSIAYYLTKKDQSWLGALSLVFIAIGSALYAIGLGADGVGPIAISAGGGKASMFFEGSGTMVTGLFIAASVLFGIGLISQVIGLIQADLLKGVMRTVVLMAAIAFIGVTAIPSGWGLYVIAAAACVIYIPVAVAFLREAS